MSFDGRGCEPFGDNTAAHYYCYAYVHGYFISVSLMEEQSCIRIPTSLEEKRRQWFDNSLTRSFFVY